MDEKQITQIIADLSKDKRKFTQSVDLLISLKELNLKKPEEQVEFFMQLPHSAGNKRKVCALVDAQMVDDAKKVMDTVISLNDFGKYDKKAMKKIAAEHDWFIGQASIMPKIAATWGRVLGPRGLMPNPKAGCIVPPKAPLAPLYELLQNTVKISVKKQPNIQVLVGKENGNMKHIAQNVLTIYDQVVHHLPREKNNIKQVSLKLTMSKPVKL